MATVNLIPTNKAAESLGISADYVRQLCARNGIGTLLNPRARYLTQKDVERLRAILDQQQPCGRPRGQLQKKT